MAIWHSASQIHPSNQAPTEILRKDYQPPHLDSEILLWFVFVYLWASTWLQHGHTEMCSVLRTYWIREATLTVRIFDGHTEAEERIGSSRIWEILFVKVGVVSRDIRSPLHVLTAVGDPIWRAFWPSLHNLIQVAFPQWPEFTTKLGVSAILHPNTLKKPAS